MFKVGVSNIQFKEEEKIMIGHKLVGLVSFILKNLKDASVTICDRLQSGPFRKRSALEFILNIFGEVKIQQKTLKEIFEDNGAREVIDKFEKWVKIIREYVQSKKELAQIYNDIDYDSSDDSDFEEIMPKNHRLIWFPQNM